MAEVELDKPLPALPLPLSIASLQYYVTYVARDKYGRMDGRCPGQPQGSAPRVCTDIAFTGGGGG